GGSKSRGFTGSLMNVSCACAGKNPVRRPRPETSCTLIKQPIAQTVPYSVSIHPLSMINVYGGRLILLLLLSLILSAFMCRHRRPGRLRTLTSNEPASAAVFARLPPPRPRDLPHLCNGHSKSMINVYGGGPAADQKWLHTRQKAGRAMKP